MTDTPHAPVHDRHERLAAQALDTALPQLRWHQVAQAIADAEYRGVAEHLDKDPDAAVVVAGLAEGDEQVSILDRAAAVPQLTAAVRAVLKLADELEGLVYDETVDEVARVAHGWTLNRLRAAIGGDGR